MNEIITLLSQDIYANFVTTGSTHSYWGDVTKFRDRHRLVSAGLAESLPTIAAPVDPPREGELSVTFIEINAEIFWDPHGRLPWAKGCFLVLASGLY